ncbi:MAG: ABC transporter ATP-binding protein [Acidobacteriia bacterium]|nr:ABC transporter ATP-binding protein [Terriglobia bacterium]
MSDHGNAPLLEMSDVEAAYGDFQALFNITLTVNRGEIVTLIGANGAGKTTTLRVISGLLRAKKGSVRFEGQEISKTPAHQIVARGISHVPEGRQLFPYMTVEEHLVLGAYIDRTRPKIPQLLDEQYAIFPRLKERRKQAAGTLSGGEQQMLAIARGLMSEPKLLLLDEPSLGLAPKLVDEVFQKIQQIGEKGVTVMVVEQNVVDGLSVSSRGYVVENGAILLQGASSDLLNNAQVRAAYLGL